MIIGDYVLFMIVSVSIVLCCVFWVDLLEGRQLHFVLLLQLVAMLFYPKEGHRNREGENHQKVNIFIALYLQDLIGKG